MTTYRPTFGGRVFAAVAGRAGRGLLVLGIVVPAAVAIALHADQLHDMDLTAWLGLVLLGLSGLLGARTVIAAQRQRLELDDDRIAVTVSGRTRTWRTNELRRYELERTRVGIPIVLLIDREGRVVARFFLTFAERPTILAWLEAHVGAERAATRSPSASR